jgi:rhodanese-related sulfurtransferase
MSKETSDRLGNQKATNYALRKDLTKEDFIQEVLTGLTEPPKYFPLNVLMNIKGYENIETVLKRGTQSLSPEAFEAAANETGALVLDTRDAEQFSNGFIPNSINIGINGNFAPWVGALIPDIQQEILLITDEGKEEEVVTRLARVGYDRSIGYLKGGFAAWAQAGKEVDRIQRISADQLAEMFDEDPGITVIDVRKKSEYDSERMTIAENIPLDHINDGLIPTGKGKTAYVHCAGGYRSMIFISILKARGFDHLIDVRGGFKAIKESGKFRLTDYVCPTTLL